MSTKLIIWIPGRKVISGCRRHRFIWSEVHNCYVFDGREISIEEFNEVYPIAEKNIRSIVPRVKVVVVGDLVLGGGQAGHDSNPLIPTSGYSQPVGAPISPPPVVTTISAREITADEAEEVLARERPERLKKKTGPKMLEVA